VPHDRDRSRHRFTDRFVCVVAADHPLAQCVSVSLSRYLRWPHLSIDIGQPVAVVMPYHARGSSILPGTELIVTVPARLVAEFADSSHVRVLDVPRELGEVQFHAVWHPRVDDDPAHSWLRQVVSEAAAPPTTSSRRARNRG
jgi:DNA-binding transcriptional LysR family regulator